MGIFYMPSTVWDASIYSNEWISSFALEAFWYEKYNLQENQEDVRFLWKSKESIAG